MLITLKKLLAGATAISSLLLLSACATAPTHSRSAGGQLNQICQNLKQEIIMGSVRGAPNQLSSGNPAQQAQLYKEYDKYQCDKVLRQMSGG